MRLTWRWDQGRTGYFSVDSLTQAARILVQFEGQNPDDVKSELRSKIVATTGLPYLPNTAQYLSIWRNYGRIYQASQIAARLADGRLLLTEVGKKLVVPGELSSDEYLLHFARSCVMPNPAFDDYDASVHTYPAASVIRLLMASERFLNEGMSANDVLSFIAGNEILGVEPPEVFASLSGKVVMPVGDEERQVREFLRFLSQLSFLHFESGRLWYSGPKIGSTDWAAIWTALTPRIEALPSNNALAVLELGRLHGNEDFSIGVFDADPADWQFTEGSRSQRTHVLLERNKKLRKQFLTSATLPIHCNVCDVAPDKKYPWTENLVEIHHLLPLSSAVKVGKTSTLLEDVVPVCPTCHRAIHKFYSTWLVNYGQKDFKSKEEAQEVYDTAKKLVA